MLNQYTFHGEINKNQFHVLDVKTTPGHCTKKKTFSRRLRKPPNPCDVDVFFYKLGQRL
jgi:hypothetical protein